MAFMFMASKSGEGVLLDDLIDTVQEAVEGVQTKIQQIRDNKESISIADMFEMQMMMNNLAQLSEMSTNVVSSLHSAIQSMARNVKS
jgi:predicted RecB family endonuclease